MPSVGAPRRGERQWGIRPEAPLGVGIEVSELPGPDPALLDASGEVGAANPERIRCREELALVDQVVQRPDRDSEAASGLSRIEPFVVDLARHPASASTVHILHAPHQFAGVDSQGRGQSGDGIEARVPLAALQRADIGPRDSRAVGERLLGQALPEAFHPDPITEQPLTRRWSLAGASHPAIKRPRSIGVDAIGVTLSTSQREGWV